MRPTVRATSRVLARKTEETARRRQLLLTVSAASALVFCSLAMARANPTVTVNADGSVTRSQTTARANMPAQGAILNNGQYSGFDQLPTPLPGGQVNSGTTTFFSGTHYPVPQHYYYGYPQQHYYAPPQGYSYPVGPVVPRVTPPMITAGPSVSSGVRHHHHHCPYYGHCAPPAVQYPAYSYPAYGTNGVYYHGPSGGGGTIESSSSTSNRGIGLSYGRGGLRGRIGNTRSTTNSTTTVTTTRPR